MVSLLDFLQKWGGWRNWLACPSLTARKRTDIVHFLLIINFPGLSSYDSNKHGRPLWHLVCGVRHLAWGLFSAWPTELVHCVARVCGLLSRAPSSAVPLGAWMASCALSGWEQLAIRNVSNVEVFNVCYTIYNRLLGLYYDGLNLKTVETPGVMLEDWDKIKKKLQKKKCLM